MQLGNTEFQQGPLDEIAEEKILQRLSSGIPFDDYSSCACSAALTQCDGSGRSRSLALGFGHTISPVAASSQAWKVGGRFRHRRPLLNRR